MADIESLQKILNATVLSLVKDCGIKHKDIITQIHDCLEKASSELPPLQILYNNEHGGFRFSQQFRQYMQVTKNKYCIDEIIDERIQCVQFIKPFGEHCLYMYPYLKDLLYIYTYYNVKYVIELADSVQYRTNKLSKLLKRYKVLNINLEDSKTHGNKHINEENCYNYLYAKNQDINGFTKDSYLYLINILNGDICEAQNQINLNVTQAQQAISPDIFDDMVKVLTQVAKDKVHSTSSPHYSAFLDAIEKYGEQDTKIWNIYTQSKYLEKAMLYLLIKKNETKDLHKEKDGMIFDFLITKDYIPIDKSIYEKVLTIFSLQCASDTYCSLSIGKVPQLVDWTIGEYDGLESIVQM